MICPVCEHAQEFGIECEVCGKALGGLDELGPPPIRQEIVAGLEQTLAAPVGEVAVERVGELEVTRHAAVGAVVSEATDIEATRAADVGSVTTEAVADFASGRELDDGVRTAIPDGPVVCRYCRHVQVGDGLFCESCANRLPPRPRPIVVAVSGGRPLPDESVRCRACGAPAKVGTRCSDCGQAVPYPET